MLTSVELINRLPSKVINNLSPYEKLFGSTPDYGRLRTFGCLAYAKNPNKKADKFSPRGVLCVFLGFLAGQKGYKLRNLISKETFVTRVVKLCESVFPFRKKQVHDLDDVTTSDNISVDVFPT